MPELIFIRSPDRWHHVILVAMPQVKRTKMSDSCASNIRVAIEYQYEPMMNDKVRLHYYYNSPKICLMLELLFMYSDLYFSPFFVVNP